MNAVIVTLIAILVIIFFTAPWWVSVLLVLALGGVLVKVADTMLSAADK